MDKKPSFKKSTLSHTTDFFLQEMLILITGAAAGATITITLTSQEAIALWGMVGSLLAGLSTVGLLWFAMKSASAWKEQLHFKDKRASLTNWYLKAIDYNQNLENGLIQNIYKYQLLKYNFDEKNTKAAHIKGSIKLIESKGENASSQRETLQKIENEISNIRESYLSALGDYHKSYWAMKDMKRELTTKEEIFIAHLFESNHISEFQQLSDYFNIDGRTVGIHQAKTHAGELLEKINSNKQKIKDFYRQMMQELKPY